MWGGPRRAARPCVIIRGSRICAGRLHQRRFHFVNSGGLLAGPIIAQIVGIHAVNDVRNAALAADFFQPLEQFVLAMETTVRIIPQIIRIFELVRLDVFVRDTELAHEGFGIALMRLRDRSRIRGHRQRAAVRTWCAAHAR